MRLIIAGGRDFDDYKFLKESVISFVGNEKDIEVVCGLARGADLLGKTLAEEMDWKIKEFPADWDKYGKSAGFIRNSEMADYATHCICFWDEISKGTKHMIDLAETKKLIRKTITYKPIQTARKYKSDVIKNFLKRIK